LKLKNKIQSYETRMEKNKTTTTTAAVATATSNMAVL